MTQTAEEKAAYQKVWRARNPEKVARYNRPEIAAYRGAKARCMDPTNRDYRHYGRRGITFEFESFEQFFAELGARPAGLTLDRIDNDQGYKPGNVRWATATEQNNNRREHAPRETKSGHPGISFANGSFSVYYKSKYIGCRKTLEQAINLKESYEIR